MKTVGYILALICATCWAPHASAEISDSQYQAFVSEAIEAHARPRFEELGRRTEALYVHTRTACADSEDLNQNEIHQAFTETVRAWSSAHHLRWGPARQEYRHERFAFGADPANYVARQLGRIIQAGDPALLDAEKLKAKSIAIQGLTAFELLLVTPPATEETRSYHCSLAEIISLNLRNMAAEMVAGWRAEADYVALLNSPDPEHLFISTDREAAMEFYKPMAGGIRFLIDIDLKDPMQNGIKTSRPHHAAYWRTQNSNIAIKAKLTALNAVFTETGFSDNLRTEDVELYTQMSKRFAAAHTAFDQLTLPMAEAVKDPEQRKHIQDTIEDLDALWSLIVYDMARIYGFKVGFNEFDGD